MISITQTQVCGETLVGLDLWTVQIAKCIRLGAVYAASSAASYFNTTNGFDKPHMLFPCPIVNRFDRLIIRWSLQDNECYQHSSHSRGQTPSDILQRVRD